MKLQFFLCLSILTILTACDPPCQETHTVVNNTSRSITIHVQSYSSAPDTIEILPGNQRVFNVNGIANKCFLSVEACRTTALDSCTISGEVESLPEICTCTSNGRRNQICICEFEEEDFQ